MGQWDEDAVRAALALGAPYLGVVASQKRFAQIRESLTADGVALDALTLIRNPAGLDIGAQLPEEIALSVLAQIVQVNNAAAQTAAPKPAPALPMHQAPASPIQHAIDPICGMTVTIATARHTAEFEGRAYYFCCGGCRETFLREPARHAAATARGGH
jgi:xanthine dehydrogenase accessory factor